MGQALVYSTVVVCAAGCVLRIFLAGYYRMILRALRSMKTTKNRWMKQLKEQFILRYQAMLGVQNVESFVERFLANRRILGIPLNNWNGMHIQLACFCLLAGAVVALFFCTKGAATKEILLSMFQGIWTSALLLVVDGFCMVSAKMDAVRSGMCDYLENYLQVCLEHDYEVWGKNREELRQTKAVQDAQLQVIDEKAYQKQRKLAMAQTRAAEKLQKTARKEANRLVKQTRMVAKRKPEVENKIRKDVALLKKEVEERRKRDAEAMVLATAAEIEKSTSRQVEEILQGLI